MNSADWPDEASLYPYGAVTSLPARRLLVLAPHPDDEVLGCGGLIAAMLAQGAEVQVVIVSDGGQGGDAAQRERESIAAAAVLAGGRASLKPVFWRLPDRGLAMVAGLAQRLQGLISSSAADCVLLPSPYEIHPDHRALCLAGVQALRGAEGGPELLLYEVGQPLMPDVLVDITAQFERKRAALRCFTSQLAVQAYDDQVLGLNRFRAYTLGPAVSHAEAYRRVTHAQRRGGLDAVLQGFDTGLRARFGLGPRPA
jgi:LmbE family N-acetylglucosaminyl deacetylase